MQFGRLADRTDREGGVVHVLGDIFRTVLRGDVDRDAVIGPVDFLGEERLVVRGVVPGGRAGDHVAVKRLGVFECLDGFRRVEDYLVVLVDDLAALRPQAPVHPGVAVAGGVAEREAAGRALRLHRLGIFEEFVGLGREGAEPGLLRRFDTIVDQRAGIADRDRDPLVAVLAVFDGAVDPAAMRLAEIVGDVGHIEALLREQVRQRIQTPEQVGAGAGVGGDRCLRLHVFIGFARDIDRDAGRLREGGDQLYESVVFGLHEIFPAQHRQLGALLRLPRRALRPGFGPIEQGRSGQCAGGAQRGGAFNDGAARKISHRHLLPGVSLLDFRNSGVCLSRHRTDEQAWGRV